MKRFESALARAALAATLGLATGAANAVPVVFDFVGTVNASYYLDFMGGNMTPDPSMFGQSVIGRITVETDQLQSRTDVYPVQRWTTLSETGEAVTSDLAIGGATYDAGEFAGAAGFIDGMEFHSESYLRPDRVGVADASTQYWSAPGEPSLPDGSYLSRRVGLYWEDPNDSLGLIDLVNGFDPVALLPVLAALVPTGYYQEETNHCYGAADGCLTVSGVYTYFSIDSLSISTASVPEPSTLALFAVGLLGTGLTRRSRRR